MADPNSLLTVLRRVLVKLIEPHPDPGETWCIGCPLNNGRTIILQADGYEKHIQQHLDRGEPKERVKIDASWSAGKKNARRRKSQKLHAL